LARSCRRAPLDTTPANKAEAIVASEEEIIGDVEIAGAGIFGPDAEADVFKAAVFSGEPDCAEDFFLAGENSDIGVFK
jgi:hypothetical protein